MGLCDKDHTEKYTVQLIKSLCAKFNVCVVASRVDMSVFANDALGYQRKWQPIVSTRCELEVKLPSNYNNNNNDEDDVDRGDDLNEDENDSEDLANKASADRTLDVKRFIKVMSISQENSARKVIKTAGFQLESSTGFSVLSN